MNSHGTFVVNGIYRIVVNQILISLGIYYHSKLDHNRINYIYTGTLISDWGRRSKLEIDVGEKIWARVSRKRKISIPVLLSAMGLNLKEILDNTCYLEKKFFLLKKKKGRWEWEEYIWSKEKSILEFYKKLYCVSGNLVFSESLCKELQEICFRQRCELGNIGRRNLNQKMNLDIPENEIFSLPQDVLAVVDYLIGVKFGMGTLNDIDHLRNRCIRSVADLLQNQFRLALGRLEDAVRRTIHRATKRRSTPHNLVTSTLLKNTFQDFFGSHPLAQFLDQTNPLTEIAHGRKLSHLGSGGLTR
jgi:DNA-directed RNA polymerase subunit beta